MVVTATEFKANFGKYLELITKEDIFITRNGKTVAKVVNPQVSAVDSLRGMLNGISSDMDKDSLREERLLKYEDNVWHERNPWRIIGKRIFCGGFLQDFEALWRT